MTPEQKHIISLCCDGEVLATAEEIQKHMHEFVDYLVKNTSCSYQDAVNCYFISKLSQLQLSIQK